MNLVDNIIEFDEENYRTTGDIFIESFEMSYKHFHKFNTSHIVGKSDEVPYYKFNGEELLPLNDGDVLNGESIIRESQFKYVKMFKSMLLTPREYGRIGFTSDAVLYKNITNKLLELANGDKYFQLETSRFRMNREEIRIESIRVELVDVDATIQKWRSNPVILIDGNIPTIVSASEFYVTIEADVVDNGLVRIGDETYQID